jgi:hypothetical protein
MPRQLRHRQAPVSYATRRTDTLFSPSQVGYQNAPVIFTFDVYGTATSGYWTLSLNRTTLVTSAVYKDAELATGSMTWTMTPDKCVLNAY